MISVGIFTYSTKPRGSVVHAACLAEALQRQGAQVTLYALSKAGDGFYRDLSCPVRLIRAEAAPTEVDALIRQRIAEFRAGIRALRVAERLLHAEDCLAANALAGAKTELRGACLVRTVHHVEHFESRYLRACQERSVAAADVLLSVSEVTRREVRAAFGREATVISNGVDLNRFTTQNAHDVAAVRAKLELRPGERLILSVGGVEARKNSLKALDAVALAYAQHPHLRWAVVGGASIWEHEAYRAAFARRLAELPVELRARITILNTVPEAELTALYQASDILLCPSLQEGFGLCVLEALAARCAVIVPHGAPFDEYLDPTCASFVDPSAADDIARALCSLIENSDDRTRLAQAGHERVQRYSWDRVAEQHLIRYQAALRRAEPLSQLETF
ncbi:MAG TPA: MSMEG_0565 family glycosyltransferase [Polyangiaceae bacterium]